MPQTELLVVLTFLYLVIFSSGWQFGLVFVSSLCACFPHCTFCSPQLSGVRHHPSRSKSFRFWLLLTPIWGSMSKYLPTNVCQSLFQINPTCKVRLKYFAELLPAIFIIYKFTGGEYGLDFFQAKAITAENLSLDDRIPSWKNGHTVLYRRKRTESLSDLVYKLKKKFYVLCLHSTTCWL